MFIQMCCSFSSRPGVRSRRHAGGGRHCTQGVGWGVGVGAGKARKIRARPTASLVCRRGTAVAHGGRVGDRMIQVSRGARMPFCSEREQRESARRRFWPDTNAIDEG